MNQNIHGNDLARAQTLKVVNEGIGPLLLEGPYGVGKYKFLCELLTSLHDDVETVSPETEIDLVKKLLKEQDVGTLNHNNKIIIRDIDKFSDACKDLLLVYSEKESFSGVLYFISEDPYLMGEPLLSRMRSRIKWDAIDLPSYLKSSDQRFYDMSSGSFAIFNSLNEDKKFLEFFDILIQEDWPDYVMCNPLHHLIKDFKDSSEPRKRGLSNLFSLASRSSKHKKSLLSIANLINKYPSINLTNHYIAKAAECLSAVD